MSWRARNHGPWWAFFAQRASGVALALFLPAHFLLLSLALQGEAALDTALAWTEAPLVKLAEIGLVVLLGIHVLGGLRILAVEFLPWTDTQKNLIALAAAGALVLGGLFGLNAF
ncbi:MAG: succinate dehydrogenase [Rhodospirillales bacterium]|nr:succinate dehydrogenase [Rhodospirillales bacterium]